MNEPIDISNAAEPPCEKPKAGGTVLLVDDSSIVLQILSGILTKAGYHVVTAANGVEAQKKAEAATRVDLLMTDYDMPGMNGVELATLLRERWPPMPVLLFSSEPSYAVFGARAKLPFVTCIDKSTPVVEVEAAVELAISSTRR